MCEHARTYVSTYLDSDSYPVATDPNKSTFFPCTICTRANCKGELDRFIITVAQHLEACRPVCVRERERQCVRERMCVCVCV